MTHTAVAPAASRAQQQGWLRALSRGIGQTLITVGVVILLFVGYELWFTGLYTKAEQHQLTQQLQHSWQNPPAAIRPLPYPRLGSGFAIVWVPRLGRHWRYVIVEGTDTAALKKGPGHYPDTALPGEVGNFAVAGHRTTYLAPFYNLDRVHTGNRIYIETRTAWFVYRVQNIPGTAARAQEIVNPSDVEVAFAVPDQSDPTLRPTLKVLTFTTCNPRYSAEQRLVVHALLIQSRPRSLGPPPGLVS